MTEYIRTFGNFTLTVDVILLFLIFWCCVKNTHCLYLSGYKYTGDADFRIILLIFGGVFFYANCNAFSIHLDTYIYQPIYILSKSTVERQLKDRASMCACGVLLCMLTYKYKIRWYS